MNGNEDESVATAPAAPLTIPTHVPVLHLRKGNTHTSFFASTVEEKEDHAQNDNKLEYIPSRQKDMELEKSVKEDSLTASRVPDRHSSRWQPPTSWNSASYVEDEHNGQKEGEIMTNEEREKDIEKKVDKEPSRPRLGLRRRTS